MGIKFGDMNAVRKAQDLVTPIQKMWFSFNKKERETCSTCVHYHSLDKERKTGYCDIYRRYDRKREKLFFPDDMACGKHEERYE
jgi:exonuclease III